MACGDECLKEWLLSRDCGHTVFVPMGPKKAAKWGEKKHVNEKSHNAAPYQCTCFVSLHTQTDRGGEPAPVWGPVDFRYAQQTAEIFPVVGDESF